MHTSWISNCLVLFSALNRCKVRLCYARFVNFFGTTSPNLIICRENANANAWEQSPIKLIKTIIKSCLEFVAPEKDRITFGCWLKRKSCIFNTVFYAHISTQSASATFVREFFPFSNNNRMFGCMIIMPSARLLLLATFVVCLFFCSFVRFWFDFEFGSLYLFTSYLWKE